MELLVAIVKYKTVLKKVRQGLCSKYLASLPENSVLRVTYSSNGKFYDEVKKDPKRPVIMSKSATQSGSVHHKTTTVYFMLYTFLIITDTTFIVAPGTGVAPCRSLIYQRAQLVCRLQSPTSILRTLMIPSP